MKVTEALFVFFVGPKCVRKLARSIAAARLPLHALCKLPFGKAGLTSKQGRLATPSLRALRQKWGSAIAPFLDEVTMVAGGQLHRADV
ncbi:hypothetical protein N9L68_00105 [bacterium]|nr:hypothetical protein [bacterium]